MPHTFGGHMLFKHRTAARTAEARGGIKLPPPAARFMAGTVARRLGPWPSVLVGCATHRAQ